MIEIKYEESRRAAHNPFNILGGHLQPFEKKPWLSTSSSLTSGPFPQHGLYQTAWFPKLIILMFSMALGIGSIVLLTFSGNTSYLTYSDYLKSVVKIFCLMFGVCTLVLLIFISICLAVQSNRLRMPSWLEGWKQSFEKLGKKKQLIILKCLWTAVIISLLTASASLIEGLTAIKSSPSSLSLWTLLHDAVTDQTGVQEFPSVP